MKKYVVAESAWDNEAFANVRKELPEISSCFPHKETVLEDFDLYRASHLSQRSTKPNTPNLS